MSSRDEIIDDLIRRKPRGPDGVDLTYEVSEEYNYTTDKVAKVYVPSVEGYGYSDDDMFSLGLLDRSDVIHYLRQRDFEGKSDWSLGRTRGTLTRRANNVWSKIGGAIKRVLREGRPGIYEVKGSHYRDEFGHIYAETKEEARQNAELFFGYLHNSHLSVEFKKMGSISDLASLNLESQKSMEESMQETQNQIDRYQTILESLNSRLSTLKIVEQQQIAVEMLHAAEEAANMRSSEPDEEKE